VLDFGVARLRDENSANTLVTTTGEILGTLAYMSPEQINGSSDAVDTRSDVYALGCILYELLSGSPPLDLSKLSVAGASARIAHDRPPLLRYHDRALRGDLELIAAKALEKDPERRYPSAAALADDVRRFLACQPIAARKPSPFYVARKWIGRHRVACALGGLTAFSLALGAIGVIAGMVRSERARQSRQQVVSALLKGVNGIATDVLPRLSAISGTAETRRDLLAELKPMGKLLQALRGDDPRLMAIEADLLDAIASLESDFSDAQTRLAARHAVLEARQRLIDTRSDDRRQVRRFAIDHVRVGDIQNELQDVSAAQAWYRRAFDIELELLRAEPDNIDARFALTWSNARLAHIANRLGLSDDAAAHLHQMQQLLDDLAVRTGGEDAVRLLDCRQQLLALQTDRFSAAGSLDGVYRSQVERVECLRQLVQLDSSNRVYLVRAAGAMVNLAGHELGSRGDCDAARRCLEDAQPHIARLARLEPLNSEACEVRANALHITAQLAAIDGRTDDALRVTLRARFMLVAQSEHAPSRHMLSQLDFNATLCAEFASACGLPTVAAEFAERHAALRADLERRLAIAAPGAQ
jgi:hypothetical protein